MIEASIDTLGQEAEPITTSTKATLFTDGMVITADDLSTAMVYPLDMMRALNRAYFGCGIVCGLSVEAGASTGVFTLKPGLALDCAGYPVQVPRDTPVDVAADPCETSDTGNYYLAISRTTIAEKPRDDTEICESTKAPKVAYSRLSEATRICLFATDNLPNKCCDPNAAAGLNTSTCDCLKQCTEDECYPDESWIVVARINIDDEDNITLVDDFTPRYVKPIHCACTSSYDLMQDEAISANAQALGKMSASDKARQTTLADNKKALENLQSSISNLEKGSDQLKKELKQAADSAVNEKAFNEKLKGIESSISQMEKTASTLEKSLNDKLVPAELEKALERKFNAMEAQLAQLEAVTEVLSSRPEDSSGGGKKDGPGNKGPVKQPAPPPGKKPPAAVKEDSAKAVAGEAKAGGKAADAKATEKAATKAETPPSPVADKKPAAKAPAKAAPVKGGDKPGEDKDKK